MAASERAESMPVRDHAGLPLALVHALQERKPAAGRETADAAHQDLHAGLERGGRVPRGPAVHQREQGGIGQAELAGEIPARLQVLDRVPRGGIDVLRGATYGGL